jgi:hypothetical protein
MLLARPFLTFPALELVSTLKLKATEKRSYKVSLDTCQKNLRASSIMMKNLTDLYRAEVQKIRRRNL